VAQTFHFAILRIEVTRASRGLSAIAELLVCFGDILTTSDGHAATLSSGFDFQNDVSCFIYKTTLKRTVLS